MKLLNNSVENSPRRKNMDLISKNVVNTLSGNNLRKVLSPGVHLSSKLLTQASQDSIGTSSRHISNTFLRNRENLHDQICRKLKAKYIDTNPFF